MKRHACGFKDQKLIGQHKGIKILNISIVEPLNEVERISLPQYETVSVWCLSQEEVAASIVNYYQALFSSSNPIQAGSTIGSIPNVISDDMNTQLSTDYMAWRVGVAIKQMAPLKALSLDGIFPLFYQNYWQLVGNDVTQSILNFFKYCNTSISSKLDTCDPYPKSKKPQTYL